MATEGRSNAAATSRRNMGGWDWGFGARRSEWVRHVSAVPLANAIDFERALSADATSHMITLLIDLQAHQPDRLDAATFSGRASLFHTSPRRPGSRPRRRNLASRYRTADGRY